MPSEITTVTLLTELKRIINDPDAQFMTDAEYTRTIMQYILPEQSFVFQLITTGYFAYQGGDKLYLWNPSFTGNGTANYTLNSIGSIVVSSGTDASSTISVTGARVNFTEVVCEVLRYLATHKAKEISQSGAYGSISPEDVYQKLMTMYEYWRGAFAIC